MEVVNLKDHYKKYTLTKIVAVSFLNKVLNDKLSNKNL